MSNRSSAIRVMGGLASMVIVIGGLKLAADFIVPIILALFIAIISFPIMRWLRARRVPRFVAVFLTLLANISVLVGFVLIGAGLVSDFQENWSKTYQPALLAMATRGVAFIELSLENMGVQGADQAFSGAFEVDRLLALATDNLGGVIGGIAYVMKLTFLVLILLGFMLAEGRGYGDKLREMSSVKGPDLGRFSRASQDIQKYLGIKFAVSAATGIFAWFLCWAIGLDFPILWGMVAFAFNFIPAIGSIIAAIPPALLAAVQLGIPSAVFVLVGYGVINLIWGNIIEPTLLGRRFGLTSVVVILSVLFWGWILGPVGMFLAVPLTMIVKVMLDTYPDLRWISLLMEKEQRGPSIGEVLISGGTLEEEAEAEGVVKPGAVGVSESSGGDVRGRS